jgi:hypothetical protein
LQSEYTKNNEHRLQNHNCGIGGAGVDSIVDSAAQELQSGHHIVVGCHRAGVGDSAADVACVNIRHKKLSAAYINRHVCCNVFFEGQLILQLQNKPTN